MRIKDLLKNKQVSLKFYATKDIKGVLFYNGLGHLIEAPEFNNIIDCFILNPAAKCIICISDMKMQMSDLLVDYFSDEEVLDEQKVKQGTYVILG